MHINRKIHHGKVPCSGPVPSWGMQLWLHAQQGRCEEVERLLQNQEAASGGTKPEYGLIIARALRVSIVNDHVDTAAVLMTRAPRLVQLHERSCGGFQHIHITAAFGSCDTLRFLLAMKADAEAHSTRSTGPTPLLLAAERGHLGTVQLLLAHRVPVDARDMYRRTALMRAAQQGYVAVAQLLLTHKANVDLRDDEGFMPLLFAALGGHVEVSALLMCSKARVDAADDVGITPLACAASGAHCDVAVLLLRYRAAVDPVTNHNADVAAQTPLHLACQCGHVDMATLLLDSKASLDLATIHGHTPLAYAVSANHLAAAALLLRRSANLECTDARGRTPLAEVCARPPSSAGSLRIRRITAKQETQGRLDMAQFLLDAKASVDTVDDHDATPLALAIQSGSVAMASLVRSRCSGP